MIFAKRECTFQDIVRFFQPNLIDIIPIEDRFTVFIMTRRTVIVNGILNFHSDWFERKVRHFNSRQASWASERESATKQATMGVWVPSMLEGDATMGARMLEELVKMRSTCQVFQPYLLLS